MKNEIQSRRLFYKKKGVSWGPNQFDILYRGCENLQLAMNSSNGWYWFGTKKVCVVDLRPRVFKGVPALYCRWRGLIEHGWVDRQLTWSTSLTGHPQLHGVVTRKGIKTYSPTSNELHWRKEKEYALHFQILICLCVLAWACVSVFVLQIFPAKIPGSFRRTFFLCCVETTESL